MNKANAKAIGIVQPEPFYELSFMNPPDIPCLKHPYTITIIEAKAAYKMIIYSQTIIDCKTKTILEC